jgi:hypothetical protein
MQKLSTEGARRRQKIVWKTEKFCKLTFYTYNIIKIRKIDWNLNFNFFVLFYLSKTGKRITLFGVVIPARQAWNQFLGTLKGIQIHVRSLCWIFKQSMEARNRVGIGLSYRPARLHGWRN